jgi:hypothetical protein
MPASIHRWIVDLIEESTASIEVDGNAMIRVPQSLLPRRARAGHVLKVTRKASADGQRSTVTIELDEPETQRALAESAEQVSETANQENDPGGDITL